MGQPYDLVVIGGGSGGVRAARMAASHGARVAVVEEYRYGGTCVIRGCVPKKFYVYASRFSDAFETAADFGWTVDAKFDWSTLKANKDTEIARLENIYVFLLEKSGVEVIRDSGIVSGPNTVRLAQSGRELETRYILIATGGTPFRPDIPGAELGLTSNEVFEMESLPDSILIEGAGYVAVEFATVFAGLGVKTTLSYRGDHILRGFDEDVRQTVQEGLQARGVEFIFNVNVAALESAGQGVRAKFDTGEENVYGAMMFATGRTPNTKGIGLRELGVAMDERGKIAVDPYSQTSISSIYAVGDVTGRAELTPVAIREGAAFAETAFNDNPTAVDHSLIATAVFCEPEVGTIGLTEEQAVMAHRDIDVYVARFRPMMHTLGDNPQKMLLKLITAGNTGKVVGCHIVGPHAGEMIQLVAIPMGMGATKTDFDRAIAVHPTVAEELVTFKAPSYRYRDGAKTT